MCIYVVFFTRVSNNSMDVMQLYIFTSLPTPCSLAGVGVTQLIIWTLIDWDSGSGGRVAPSAALWAILFFV